MAGGGFPTPITGYFEAPTRAAVVSFQAAKGLATLRRLLQSGDLAGASDG